MTMLPPAIAMFSAILKKHGHDVQIFDTTYYSLDYGMDSDGSKMERLNVVPFKMETKGIKRKTTDWKKDLHKQISNFKPDLLILGHADRVSNENLRKIKKNNKNIKISQWFLDPLSKHGPDHLNNSRRKAIYQNNTCYNKK